MVHMVLLYNLREDDVDESGWDDEEEDDDEETVTGTEGEE